MGLSSNEFAKRDGGSIEIASEAVRLNWPLTGMTTADSHALAGKFSCSARVADNSTDRKMFVEVLLRDRQSASVADVAAQFSDAILSAASRVARTRSADEWIGGQHQKEMIDALRAAAKPIAFACGLELLPPDQLDLSSPSLSQQRQAETARARAEAMSAGRLEHLKHAGEMMTQFQEMRRATPDLPAGVLLDRLAPGDRGAMLQMLLAGSADQSEPPKLWAVAGQNLLRIDTRTSSPRVESIALPATLGPLRSVQSADLAGERTLLIGARTGVFSYSLSPCGRGLGRGVTANLNVARLSDAPQTTDQKVAQLSEQRLTPHPSPLPQGEREPEPTPYVDPLIQSDLGFNRAIVWQNYLLGCHGDAGIIGWRIDQPESPAFRIAPPTNLAPVPSSGLNTAGRARRPSPRNLEVIDDNHAIYSVGGTLKLLAGDPASGRSQIDLPSQNSAEVIAILAEPMNLLIVREDGSIDVLDRQTRAIASQLRGGGKICSAAALPWMGTVRLLLANDDGPIDLVGVDDSNVLRYTSTHRGLRQLTACPQQIVGVSSDRQRLIIWRPWEATAVTEIHVSAITGHRVADVEFG